MSGETPETPETKKTPTPTGGRSKGTGNFMMGIIVPLVAYYFIAFQLYSKSFNSPEAKANVVTQVGVLKIVLLAVIFISMYGMNTSQMKQMCPKGTKNMVSKVFLSTFIPFIFMLGTVVVAITLMPGWKSPFSNTIGYSLVKNVIYRKLFSLQDWLKEGSNGDKDKTELQKFNRRSNRTFFVNELTPENFDSAINTLGINFKDDTSTDYNVKETLYKAVVVKDSIAEFLWIFITSILTFSLSQIYIIDNSCEPDVDTLIAEDENEDLED